MQRKARLVLTSVGIQECSDYGPLIGSVYFKFTLLIQTQTPIMLDTHTKSCHITSGAKRVNVFRLDMSNNATSCNLCSLRMG